MAFLAPQAGVDPRNGRPWNAHVVSYRPAGAETWRLFLLTTPDERPPAETMVLRAIAEHEDARPSVAP